MQEFLEQNGYKMWEEKTDYLGATVNGSRWAVKIK